MKKTRILSFLLVFAMLCGLVCIPTTAEVNSADDWQLPEGWEANPLTFTFSNYLNNTLVYNNPNAATETAGEWEASFDVIFDDSVEIPDQRMNIDIDMQSGQKYRLVLQRRYNDHRIRTQFRLNGADAYYTLNAEKTAGEMSASGTADTWSNNLATANAIAAETAFTLTLKYDETNGLVMTLAGIDGTVYFTLTDAIADGKAAITNADEDVVKKITVTPDTSSNDGSTKHNFWDLIPTVKLDGAVDTDVQNPANYKIGTAWSYSTGLELHHDNATAKGANATYTGATAATNEGFELQFDINYLDFTTTSNVPNAMTHFKIGNTDILIRLARRYNADIFKNYHTIEVKGPSDNSWTKITDKWVNTPEYTSYRFSISRVANSGVITMKWSLIDGTELYTTTTDSAAYDLSGALSNFNFYGQNNVGSWKYTNMSLKTTADNTNWTEIKAFDTTAGWTLGAGWTYVNAYSLINATKKENEFAKYELFTNKVGDFKISYEVDFLTKAAETQNNFEFYLGDTRYSVRTALRTKNLFMFTSKKGSDAEIKFSDSWVDPSNGVGDRATVSITYDVETVTLVCVVNFYDGATRTWGQTVTVTNGEYKINTEAATTNAAIVLNDTDALQKITMDAGKNAGVYRVKNLFIDTEADVNTNGFKLVGVQDTDPAAEKINVRFVGVVDQPEDFQKIGIKVTAYLNGEKHKDFDIATTEVYKAITGSANGVNSTITAEELGGEYVYALTIKGVPASGTVTFEVTPYTVDVNDSSNVTDYATYEVVYQNGEYVSGTKAAE